MPTSKYKSFESYCFCLGILKHLENGNLYGNLKSSPKKAFSAVHYLRCSFESCNSIFILN